MTRKRTRDALILTEAESRALLHLAAPGWQEQRRGHAMAVHSAACKLRQHLKHEAALREAHRQFKRMEKALKEGRKSLAAGIASGMALKQ